MTAAKVPRRRNRLAITSIDVALAAGVHQSVVSRAFSLDPSVASATRERIFAVADRLGYRRNLLARSLITRNSNLIALVTGALSSTLHLQIIDALTAIAQQRDYRVLLFVTPRGGHFDESLEQVLHYRPDAVLTIAGTPSETMVQDCRRSGVPVVLLGRTADETSASSVSCDNQVESAAIARLLLDSGHRRFAFITSENPALSFSRDRQRGFCATIVGALGDPPVIENGGSSYAQGYAAGQRLLNLKRRPEAVFCASDTMALGVMDAAQRERGLTIPRDLSVVGFDDVPMAAWAGYELTTVRQRVDVMVEAALSIALDHTGRSRAEPIARLVPGQIIVRRSARLPVGFVTDVRESGQEIFESA